MEDLNIKGEICCYVCNIANLRFAEVLGNVENCNILGLT